MKKLRQTFGMTSKEIITTTIITIIAAPIVYWGTIALFGLLYAVTGVR